MLDKVTGIRGEIAPMDDVVTGTVDPPNLPINVPAMVAKAGCEGLGISY